MAIDFGKTATKLVKELASHIKADAISSNQAPGEGTLLSALPKYKEEEIQQALQEVNEHYSSLANITNTFTEEGIVWEDRPEISASVLIHHQSLLRNKRLLLAYLNMRLNRMKQYRWHCGRLPSSTQENMCNPEKEFIRSYEKILANYQKQLDIDITVGLNPPSEIFIKVRVLEDLGTMEFDYLGEVDLQVGTVHMLPCEDAERLIMEGKLEHLVVE